MTRAPLISIVIPCYNYGAYLIETIESVLASTFQDIEIIVVDDGSTDPDTVKVLAQLNLPKTRIMRQSNQGVAAARNSGMRASNGKYILPLDAEDLIHPTFLEKAFWIMEFYPQVGFVSPRLQTFGTEDWANDYPQYNFHTQLFHNYVCGTSLIRKEAFIQSGGYKNGFVTMGYEDWDLWISIGETGWYGYQIFERLFLYRRHGHSMIHDAMEYHDQLIQQIRERHPKLYQENSVQAIKLAWEDSPLLRMAHQHKKDSDWHSYASKPIPPNKPRWLLLMPHAGREWLSPAGLHFVDGIHREYCAVTVAATSFAYDTNMEAFGWLTDDIFHLPLYVPNYSTHPELMELLLAKLIMTRGIERIFILGTWQGYDFKPYLMKAYPHIPFEIIE